MSRTMNIMIAVRKSLIEKYKIAAVITGTGRTSRFLDFYGTSELYDYFDELASEHGDRFRPEYFDDSLEELYFTPYLSEDQSKKELRIPNFMSASVLNAELERLWNIKIAPSDDKEYDQYLEEDRQLKITSINRLLGQLDIFADSFEYIDIKLVYWID